MLIGHRGCSEQGYTENTIESIKYAQQHCDMVEIDVRLTRDQQLVVYHDYSLLKLHNVDRRICDCRYTELQQYNIPLLKDVLDIITKKVYIDIKGWRILVVENLIELLRTYPHNIPNKNIYIASFNYVFINYLTNRTSLYNYGFIIDSVEPNVIIPHHVNFIAITYEYRNCYSYIKKPKYIYTVNSIKDGTKILQAFDGLITDIPTLFSS